MKVYKINSSDEQIIEVEEAVFTKFEALSRILSSDDAPITLSQVTGQILSEVIDYCKKHIYHKLKPLPDEEINAWDREYVNVDMKTLEELLKAADFLDVKDLFDLICSTLARMMRDKNPQQIRDMFMPK